MFTRGDFHIHTTASDGYLNPRQVVMFAKSRGIDTIAISDHNSIDGIYEASEAGKEFGVSVIPAIELSTRFDDESIHVLGYFKDDRYNSLDFHRILRLVKAREAYKVTGILDCYRKHHANKHLSTVDGIFLLKTCGASVVLAHPVRISEKNLPWLLNMPFDGIEAKYSRSTDYQIRSFISVATEKFSYYTAGSDFHTNEPSDRKHSLIGEPFLDSTEIQKFLEKSEALVLGNTSDY
ncbi:PHP domain-containing protein [Clostridium cellulovorans]|uniref:PHP domain protein n=1 Tax=Clostridium cellulovorans (strain ATCC 35296 / DSM 3052 / OCM 3 / 743B) TaxID=573061 RepID=D9STA9_CLOC7|nr:PHP domain-containing protein [Clostridium cellulovorans]ADL50725.1 PHP domain protein [Clostridium cellulovorans 743B]